jgi:hypothetical protein
VPARDGVDAVEVDRSPVEVHDQNGLGAWGDGGLEPFRVEVERAGVRFHRDRGGPGRGDPEPGGDVGVRRHDHLVARPDVQRPDDQLDRVEPRADGHAVRPAAVLGELGLERRALRSEQVPPGLEHPPRRRVEVLGQFSVGRLQVEERDTHAALLASARNSS